MIVGLIAFAGVATDVGMLFARSSQFTAAVDAATLAGAVDLADGVDAAIARAAEFLDANGWPVLATGELTGTEGTTGRGYPEFILTATWPVETYFLRVVGFEEVPITRWAAAALYSETDMPTATQAELGMLRIAGQFIFGPDSCTAQGDPISARWTSAGTINPLRDFTGGRYTYRIQVPEDFGSDPLEIQLFDPDSLNTRFGNTTDVTLTDGTTVSGRTCASSGDGDACLIVTGEGSSSNPVWIHRVDETWTAPGSGCPAPAVDEPSGNTVTDFLLYYFDGNDTQQALATFRSDATTATATDLKWVTPGIDVTSAVTGTFLISNGQLSAVPQDGYGNRSLYLDVETVAGTSKNAWDLWAGPSTVADNLPADGNARDLYILNNLESVGTGGVEVFAQGYLPVTSYLFDPLTLPIAAVSSAQGGGTLYVTTFDFELPASAPFQFNFNTMAMQDRPPDLAAPRTPLCDGGADCNDEWVEPPFSILIPSITANVDPTPFYGGYLTVDYTMNADEHVWAVSLAGGRPFLTR
jgi:hypothetical protein